MTFTTIISMALTSLPNGGIDVTQDVTSSIKDCRSRLTPSTEKWVVGTCKGMVLGLAYTIDQRGYLTAEFTDDEYSSTCIRDGIYRTFTCSLLIGKNGNYVHVTQLRTGKSLFWGSNSYPGSEKSFRIGDSPVVRMLSKQQLSVQESERLILRMEYKGASFFRFYSWPENFPVTIKINSNEFRPMRILFSELSKQIAEGKWSD